MNFHVRIFQMYFMCNSESFGDMKNTYERILIINMTIKINTNVNAIVHKWCQALIHTFIRT